MSFASHDTAAQDLAAAWSALPRHHVLHPGDVALGFRNDRLETLLGSCVAVVLTDPRRTVAAMCHIVHSSAPPAARRSDTAYASAALSAMFSRLRAVGIAPEQCEALAFGGGNVLPGTPPRMDVGRHNVDWVRTFFAQQRMLLQATHVGGFCYRKLLWTVGATVGELCLSEVPMDDAKESGACR